MAISIDLYFDKSAHEIKEIKRQRAEMLEYYRKERPERLTPELEAELTAEPTLQNNQLVDILSHSTHERLPDEVQAAFIQHLMNQRSAANKTERQRKKAGFSSGEQRQAERVPAWQLWQQAIDEVIAAHPDNKNKNFACNTAAKRYPELAETGLSADAARRNKHINWPESYSRR